MAAASLTGDDGVDVRGGGSAAADEADDVRGGGGPCGGICDEYGCRGFDDMPAPGGRPCCGGGA